MKTNDFNAEAKTSRYGYIKSPVHPRAFMILKYPGDMADDPKPVGDYTLLDGDEDFGLTEKKVINLISLLNGRKALMDLGHETGIRVLYKVLNESDAEGKKNVMFYTLGKEGVSIENALLRLEKDDVIQ